MNQNRTIRNQNRSIRFFSAMLLAAILVALAQCVHHEPRPIKGLFKSKFTAVGHRGAKGLAPENTMSAFRVAAKLGLPFELDVMLCKSGEPVVIHDYTVDRTTNGTGRVADLTLEQLRALDAGSHFSPRFAGERVPTLEEVLNEFGGRVIIDIEIKYEGPSERAHEIANAVVDLVEKKNLVNKVFVTAFNPYVLEAVKKRNPALIRGQLYGTFEDSDIPYYQKVVLRNLLLNSKSDPDMLAVEHKMVDADYVREYRALGYRIITWTVNEPEDMRRLINYGVDAIITDYPGRLMKVHAQTSGGVR